MRIAVLDDDPSITDLVAAALRAAGHTCHAYNDGKRLMHELHRESFDLLVVDWMMPEISGYELLRWLRGTLNQRVPVIFVTARDAEADIVAALEAGADDYMVKPVRATELVARANAIFRRTYKPENQESLVEFGAYRFDIRAGVVTISGKPIELTQKEFNLALLFFRNIGRPLSRGHILEMVWGRDLDIPSRTMDTHVSRIRNKLDLRPENGFRLAPVYSYGYRLERLGENGAEHQGALHHGAHQF